MGEKEENFREMPPNQAEASHYCFNPPWKSQQTWEDWPGPRSQFDDLPGKTNWLETCSRSLDFAE